MFGRQRSGTPAQLLVIGLGNPEAQYGGTRHNLGAECVQLLAQRHGGRMKMGKEKSLTAEVRIGGQLVALAFPQTYMNESGQAARLLVRRYGIEDLADVVVVHDELDLPSAKVKLKLGGGTAGNNGIKSVHAHLNSPDFARVRIGIGRPSGPGQAIDYVLKRPGKGERALLDVAVEEAADAVESIVADGFERTMNRVNTGK